jgi:hypothetical protein
VHLVRIVIFISILGPSVAGFRSTWPSVQPVTRSYTFVAKDEPSDYPVVLLIPTTQGVPAYRLECHSGDYEGEYVIYFSGTFHCGLFEVRGDKATSWNLLADNTKEEQSSDWFNRGRMISGQLLGDCGEYPEYGRVRHFRMRGMEVTLQFTDLQWRNRQSPPSPQNKPSPRLQQFTVIVSVAPDATAKSATSERTTARRPPQSCLW